MSTFEFAITKRKVGSCNVRNVRSTWRNSDHWHVIWPGDHDHWCYETEADADERIAELRGLFDAALDDHGMHGGRESSLRIVGREVQS